MPKTKSSRRVYPTKDTHATATSAETGRTASVQSHKQNDNCSTQDAQTFPGQYSRAEASRRKADARHRIRKQHQQRQAARYFCQLEGRVRRV